MPLGYRSSKEKDIIRRYFDLPLLHQLHQRKREPLRYFGLPGSDALDIRTWKEVIGDVVAVERNSRSLQRLEDLFNTQMPEMVYTTHWGELDKVILTNKGKKRYIGGESYQPRVGNSYERSVGRYVWGFDVVYLDYFGPFLPNETSEGSPQARQRADALRNLFAKERVDAWQPWILLVTVEAQIEDETTQALIEGYLRSVQNESSLEVCEAVEFLLSEAATPSEGAARLIHGAASLLVSDASTSANVKVQPRGTVLYRGAGKQYMVHLAFEFTPDLTPLGAASGRLPLLLAPILRPKALPAAPWVELLPEQSPGLTRDSAAVCLDFLESSEVAEIVEGLP